MSSNVRRSLVTCKRLVGGKSSPVQEINEPTSGSGYLERFDMLCPREITPAGGGLDRLLIQVLPHHIECSITEHVLCSRSAVPKPCTADHCGQRTDPCSVISREQPRAISFSRRDHTILQNGIPTLAGTHRRTKVRPQT